MHSVVNAVAVSAEICQNARVREFDTQYLSLLRHVLDWGKPKPCRGSCKEAISVFNPDDIVLHLGAHLNCRGGERRWPLLSLRQLPQRAAIVEQLWVMRGETNTAWLKENGVHYWDHWADENGDLGPVYGEQMRHFGHPGAIKSVDQLANLIEGLNTDPHGRRHIITLWNPLATDAMALPPCHGVYMQFYVDTENRLSLWACQRSCDIPIGLPMNICQYTFMLYMIADICKMKVGKLQYSLGDAHVYADQVWYAQKLAERHPHNDNYAVLTSTGPRLKSLEDFVSRDPAEWIVSGYQAHEKMTIPVSI